MLFGDKKMKRDNLVLQMNLNNTLLYYVDTSEINEEKFNEIIEDLKEQFDKIINKRELIP